MQPSLQLSLQLSFGSTIELRSRTPRASFCVTRTVVYERDHGNLNIVPLDMRARSHLRPFKMSPNFHDLVLLCLQLLNDVSLSFRPSSDVLGGKSLQGRKGRKLDAKTNRH